MKIFLQKFIAVSAFLLVGLFSAQASHYSAGEIFYKWIGNEPGRGQFDYRVFVTLYERAGGANIPSSNVNGCAYRTSGGSSIAYSLTYLPPSQPLPVYAQMTATNPHGWLPGIPDTNNANGNGWLVQDLEGCASLADPSRVGDRQAEFRYTGVVTLTGAHPDWKFAIFPPCCRPSAISFYTNLSSGNSFYIEADLNNQIGPNSSPRIISPAAKAFCVTATGQLPFDWFQTAGETDGDSLLYKFYDAGALTGSSCGNYTPMGYAAGFSPSAPLPTPPGQPATINQRQGIFTFSITQPGNYSVVIEVEERRFDTISLTWQYIGNTVREMIIPVLPSCTFISQQGPTFNFDAGAGGSGPSGSFYDSIVLNTTQRDSLKSAYSAYVLYADSVVVGADADYTIPVYKGYDCFDNRITLNFSTKVKCSTAVPTDFRVIGPDGVARPVVDVDTKCGLDGATDEIDLILHQALDIDGNYLMQIRKGSDGNTLENECGFPLASNYTSLVEVTGCPQPTYQLDGVSVVDDRWVRLNWSGNAELADTNIVNTFNEWLILRADAGERPYSIVARDQNPASRSYIDNSFGTNGYFVDNFKYDYALLLVYNGKGREYTRFCNNIVLRQDTDRTSLTNVGLFWTPYNCIADSVLQYNVYRGKLDTVSGAIAEEFIASTTDTTYELSRPEPDSINEGFYAINVVARDPNGNAVSDSSLSNWIYYKLTYYPPPPPPEDPAPVVIPNVITPNGDLQNDRFYVKPLLDGQQFEKISFTLYNRWGNKVFEDLSFQNRNSQATGWDGTGSDGNPLAEGVYFYILKLDDPATGTSETKKGNLTLLRGGF